MIKMKECLSSYVAGYLFLAGSVSVCICTRRPSLVVGLFFSEMVLSCIFPPRQKSKCKYLKNRWSLLCDRHIERISDGPTIRIPSRLLHYRFLERNISGNMSQKPYYDEFQVTERVLGISYTVMSCSGATELQFYLITVTWNASNAEIFRRYVHKRRQTPRECNLRCEQQQMPFRALSRQDKY